MTEERIPPVIDNMGRLTIVWAAVKMTKLIYFKKFVVKASPLLVGALLFNPVMVASEIHELAPFEVLGSRFDSVGTGPVQLLDAEALAAARTGSLWEALQDFAGIHVDQPAGLGGNAMLYVRGSEPNLAKVLVDGIEVNNANDIRGGTYNFNALDLNTLRQVSLMAGPQSAIHGSDALSGVINFSTMPESWDEMTTGGSVSLAGGKGEYYDASLRQGYRMEKVYLQAGVSVTEEDDWFPGSELKASRVNLGLVSTIGESGLIRFSGFGAETERSHYPDDSGGPDFAVWDGLDFHDSEEFGTSLQWVHKFTADTVFRAKLFHYSYDEFVNSPGVAPGERDPFGVPPNLVDSELKRTGLSAYIEQNASESLSLVYGLSWLDESGKSYSEVTYPFGTFPGSYDQDVDTLSAFVEGKLHVSETGSLNAAVRMDDISNLDEVWTRRLAYVQEIPEMQSRMRLSWGDGFKKPSFFALGNPTIGNPNLLPEESDLYEFSVETTLSDGRIQIANTAFRQEYSNLIDFAEGPPPMLINLESVMTKGFQSQLRAQLPTRGWLTVTALFLKVDVVDSDELLRNRPKWRFGASFVQPIGDRMELVVKGRYVDSRLDSSIPTGTVELNEYFRLDAGLQWEASETITATIAVDNILDENYEDAIGFANPGVRARGGVRIAW